LKIVIVVMLIKRERKSIQTIKLYLKKNDIDKFRYGKEVKTYLNKFFFDVHKVEIVIPLDWVVRSSIFSSSRVWVQKAI
jgi:hypothetical protein